MKLRDAARIGNASAAMIDRLRSVLEKLDAREASTLNAVDSLLAVNEGLEGEFRKWSAAVTTNDPDDELGISLGDAPALDGTALREAIEEAFGQARQEIADEIDSYSGVVEVAEDFEEDPDEEE